MKTTTERYRHLYFNGRVTDAGLKRAVARGLITQEEHDAIIVEYQQYIEQADERLEV